MVAVVVIEFIGIKSETLRKPELVANNLENLDNRRWKLVVADGLDEAPGNLCVAWIVWRLRIEH